MTDGPSIELASQGSCVSFDNRQTTLIRRSLESYDGPSEARSVSTIGAHEPEYHKFGFRDLKNSWTIWFLKVFHAWCFVTAGILIAGVGVNLILDSFITFFLTTAISGKFVLEDSSADLVACSTCVTSIFLILMFPALLQRVAWLILDAIAYDMFNTYRRVLCCEGSCPGAFRQHVSHATMSCDMDRMRLHRALNKKCALERDIVIGEVKLFLGSQLTAAEGFGRDDVLLLDLPSQLTFRGALRPTGFDFTTKLGRLRAIWDNVCQGIIYLTLDIVPLLIATASTTDPLSFCMRMTTTAVIAASCHSCVFYIWSTTLDFCEKLTTFRQALSEAVGSSSGIRRRVSTKNFMRTSNVTVMAGYQVEMEKIFGAVSMIDVGDISETIQSRDESLNLCLSLWGCLSGHPWFVFCSFTGSLVVLVLTLTLGFASRVRALAGVLCFLLGVAAMCFMSIRQIANKFAKALPHDDQQVGIWPTWYRVNCSMSRRNALLSGVLFGFVGCGVILLETQKQHSHFKIVVGVAFCLWSFALFFTVFKAPDHLWKLMLFQACVFAAFALTLGTVTEGWKGLVGVTSLLYVTQIGCARQASRRTAYVVFKIFFGLVFVTVGTVTMLAASSKKGMVFGEKAFDFCAAGEHPCWDFTFNNIAPKKSAYQACGSSWPMGQAELEPGTVSDKCSDTHLTVIDFGQMASLSYHLPNQTSLQAAIAEEFPGWHLEHMHLYDIEQRHYTTFYHMTRQNTSIIAVRGTWSAMESLQDLNFWMPAAFLEFASMMGPSVFDSKYLLSTMVGISQAVWSVKKSQFSDLLEYVRLQADKGEYEHFYITGHSLGGGLAKMVGALVGIPAITFSAPGLWDTSVIVEPPISSSALTRGSVTVVPQNDVVPKIDAQTGSVLHIECPHKEAAKCHSITSTMCELLASCGDGGGRDIPRGYRFKNGTCTREQEKHAVFTNHH